MAATQPLLVDVPDKLLGPRLTVRPYREADAPALWAAVDESRAILSQWLPWVHEYKVPADALASIRRIRARWSLREDLVVGIFERGSGRLLGGSGLSRIDWTIRRFEIGYWLRSTAVGHGYVSETVQLLTRCAFEQLAANRVEIRMDVRNTRSRAVPVRLGFVFEGCHRRGMADVHAQPRDTDIFALIREDYAGLPWRVAAED